VLATLGPASSTPDQIRALYEAGADAFRVNMSHGDDQGKMALIAAIRGLESEIGRPMTILADLQGPKLRVGRFAGDRVELEAGQRFRLDSSAEPGSSDRVQLPHPEILAVLKPGHRLLLDDGKIVLRVVEAGDQQVMTEVVVPGALSNNKGLNVPDVVLPMAALIGCLIGLGTLASNSELTIMRAAGVSIGRIVWAVMKPMLVLMLAGILIGEYVAPLTENQAQADRALAQGGGAAQSSKRGMWHRQGQEYVHINAVQPNGILLGVTRYRFDDERRLLSASFARRAEYRDSHWMLRNVQTTVLHEDRSEVINQPEERWDIELNPELLGTVVMEPEALSVTGLWQYIHYLGEQGLNNARYWLAFWTKVLQPLVICWIVSRSDVGYFWIRYILLRRHTLEACVHHQCTGPCNRSGDPLQFLR
jgi:hypothetical protein